MNAPVRVLVTEDDPKIASFVVTGLKQNGFSVDHAEDRETGLAMAQSVDYDATVVDVMLPAWARCGSALAVRLALARRRKGELRRLRMAAGGGAV